jgi:protein farnesyltransferase subunit beta
MKDKPGKVSDFYHSCYALSGLSFAQSQVGSEKKVFFQEIEENTLNVVDPVFNVDPNKLEKAKAYFKSLPQVKTFREEKF